MEGSKDLLVLDTKDLVNPFMEGSKDLLVLDTKYLGTLSWREGSTSVIPNIWEPFHGWKWII